MFLREMRDNDCDTQSVNDSRQREDRERVWDRDKKEIYRETSTMTTVYIETLRYVIR